MQLVHSPKRLYTILHQQKLQLLEYVLVYSLTFSGGKLNGILQENWIITIPSCCSLMHLLFSISLMASIFRKQMLPSFTPVQFWKNSTDVSEVTPNLSPRESRIGPQSLCLPLCSGALGKVWHCHTMRWGRVCSAVLGIFVSLRSKAGLGCVWPPNSWCWTQHLLPLGSWPLSSLASSCLDRFPKKTEFFKLKNCSCNSETTEQQKGGRGRSVERSSAPPTFLGFFCC